MKCWLLFWYQYVTNIYIVRFIIDWENPKPPVLYKWVLTSLSTPAGTLRGAAGTLRPEDPQHRQPPADPLCRRSHGHGGVQQGEQQRPGPSIVVQLSLSPWSCRYCLQINKDWMITIYPLALLSVTLFWYHVSLMFINLSICLSVELVSIPQGEFTCDNGHRSSLYTLVKFSCICSVPVLYVFLYERHGNK